MQERSQHPVGVLPSSVPSASARSLTQTWAFSPLRSKMPARVVVIRIWRDAQRSRCPSGSSRGCGQFMSGILPRPEALIRADGISPKHRAAETVREREPTPT